MWIWPFLPVPNIWDNCMTESQQIEYLKNCVDELEKRVSVLEQKTGINPAEVLKTIDKQSD